MLLLRFTIHIQSNTCYQKTNGMKGVNFILTFSHCFFPLSIMVFSGWFANSQLQYCVCICINSRQSTYSYSNKKNLFPLLNFAQEMNERSKATAYCFITLKRHAKRVRMRLNNLLRFYKLCFVSFLLLLLNAYIHKMLLGNRCCD